MEQGKRSSEGKSLGLGGGDEAAAEAAAAEAAAAAAEGGRPSFGKKCGHLAKKQRAKFYILRRCIAMLVCWRDRNDH